MCNYFSVKLSLAKEVQKTSAGGDEMVSGENERQLNGDVQQRFDEKLPADMNQHQVCHSGENKEQPDGDVVMEVMGGQPQSFNEELRMDTDRHQVYHSDGIVLSQDNSSSEDENALSVEDSRSVSVHTRVLNKNQY